MYAHFFGRLTRGLVVDNGYLGPGSIHHFPVVTPVAV